MNIFGGGRESLDSWSQDDENFSSSAAEEEALRHAASRLAMPDALLDLTEIEVAYDERDAALWSFMRPAGRPSFTNSLLDDFERWQDLITAHFCKEPLPLDFLILGSRAPGVFCFGGDLELFKALIQAGDRGSLAGYGYRCVEILHRNFRALDLPLLTIGLVQGQALGGGFEALLSFDYLIAEKGATFGLPEVMFGLFPGMGAHAMLSRRLGTAMADRIILSNQIYTAQEMYELGIVSVLAEPGEGLVAARDFITRNKRRVNGLVAAKRAMRRAAPLELGELCDIVDIWADTALKLSESDLRLMARLAGVQKRNHVAAA